MFGSRIQAKDHGLRTVQRSCVSDLTSHPPPHWRALLGRPDPLGSHLLQPRPRENQATDINVLFPNKRRKLCGSLPAARYSALFSRCIRCGRGKCDIRCDGGYGGFF